MLNRNKFGNRIRWYLSLFFSKQIVVIKKFSMCLPEKVFDTDASFLFSELGNEDIEKLMNFHDNECTKWNFLFTKSEVEERLSTGHKCYIAKHDGKIVGMYWQGVKEVYSPDLQCMFIAPPDSTITYNAYVHERFRGKNILPILRQMAFNDFCRDGYFWSYGYSLSTNQAVNKSYLKFNPDIEGKIEYGYIMGYQYLTPKLNSICQLKVKKEFNSWQNWSRKK